MFLIKGIQLPRIVTQHPRFFVYLSIAIVLILIFGGTVYLCSLSSSDAISLLNAMSSFLIVIIGVYEINGWKRKNNIERKIKASEDFTLLFYKCYDAIRNATSIFSPMPKITHTVNEDIIKNICEFKINILKSHNDAFSEMKARSHEFRIILDEKHAEVCIEIINVRSSLEFSINEYQKNSAKSIRLKNKAAGYEKSSVKAETLRGKCLQSAKKFKEEAKKFEPIIWGRDSSRVTTQLKELEKKVRNMQAQYIQY